MDNENFGKIMPKNILEAIKLYEKHIYNLHVFYEDICTIEKISNSYDTQISKTSTPDVYEYFQDLLKICFASNDVINKYDFLNYLDQYYIETFDIALLERTYNLIHSKFYNMIGSFKRSDYNPQYLLDKSDSELLHEDLYLLAFIAPIIHNPKEAEKSFFYANDFYDFILKYLRTTLEEIDSLFSTKKLNETKQNTEILSLQNKIEFSKIDWKKDERLIPYLIHLLNEKGFIKEKNQFAFISKHFTVNGKPIIRENIKANYNEADYLNKAINKSPKEIKQLNEIFEQLKKALDAIE